MIRCLCYDLYEISSEYFDLILLNLNKSTHRSSIYMKLKRFSLHQTQGMTKTRNGPDGGLSILKPGPSGRTKKVTKTRNNKAPTKTRTGPSRT